MTIANILIVTEVLMDVRYDNLCSNQGRIKCVVLTLAGIMPYSNVLILFRRKSLFTLIIDKRNLSLFL